MSTPNSLGDFGFQLDAEALNALAPLAANLYNIKSPGDPREPTSRESAELQQAFSSACSDLVITPTNTTQIVFDDGNKIFQVGARGEDDIRHTLDFADAALQALTEALKANDPMPLAPRTALVIETNVTNPNDPDFSDYDLPRTTVNSNALGAFVMDFGYRGTDFCFNNREDRLRVSAMIALGVAHAQVVPVFPLTQEGSFFNRLLRQFPDGRHAVTSFLHHGYDSQGDCTASVATNVVFRPSDWGVTDFTPTE